MAEQSDLKRLLPILGPISLALVSAYLFLRASRHDTKLTRWREADAGGRCPWCNSKTEPSGKPEPQHWQCVKRSKEHDARSGGDYFVTPF